MAAGARHALGTANAMACDGLVKGWGCGHMYGVYPDMLRGITCINTEYMIMRAERSDGRGALPSNGWKSSAGSGYKTDGFAGESLLAPARPSTRAEIQGRSAV